MSENLASEIRWRNPVLKFDHSRARPPPFPDASPSVHKTPGSTSVLDEMEVSLRELVQRNVLQCHSVTSVIGDHHVTTDLLRM